MADQQAIAALEAQLKALDVKEAQMRQQFEASQSRVGPAQLQRLAGIPNVAMNKTTSDTLNKEALDRVSLGEARTAEEFKQTQGERDESLKRFPMGVAGGTPGVPTGIEISEAGDFREIPVTRTEEGGIQSKFERTPESLLAQKQAEADLEVNKQVKAQKQKDIADTRQDLTNARLKIGTAFDSWLDVVDRTKRISGTDPGIFGGVITEVLGKTKANEYVNAFKGGLVEYAAAVGRIAIPGARAVRMIDLFKSTAPTTFDTVPSAIATSALSFRAVVCTFSRCVS